MSYSRIKTLHIVDFQAIQAATIELGNLTVLCGQGDAGKSSLLRAFRALCLNDATDDDIRHGAKRCQVAVLLEDGTEISWWKQRKQGGCYSIHSGKDYAEFVKTGGEVPVEVSSLLGIGQVEVDSTTTIEPQLSDQFDLPFLLYETGSKRARILGKATRLDTVVTAQMNCKKEHGQAQGMVKEIDSSIESVERQLAGIPDYEDLAVRVAAVYNALETITVSRKLAGRAVELDAELSAARAQATAVDTGALRFPLETVESDLDRAATLSDLYNDLVVAESKTRTLAEEAHGCRAELAVLTAKYEEACGAAGVCEQCGGLLDHKECTR